MNKKDTMVTLKRLSHDSDFYNNVFKKSEKISSVILYVLSFKNDSEKRSLTESLLEEKSFKLHQLSLKALNTTGDTRDELYDLRQGLIEVASTLELATAARVITSDIAAMLSDSVDQVQRYLTNHYLSQDAVSIELLHKEYREPVQAQTTSSVSSPAPAKPRRQQRVAIPANDISSDAYLVHSQMTDRAERIKTVLEAKPQASVKDISQIITDVSEKTIQRELNSLIEQGKVQREGERRWSRYSVIKD